MMLRWWPILVKASMIDGLVHHSRHHFIAAWSTVGRMISLAHTCRPLREHAMALPAFKRVEFATHSPCDGRTLRHGLQLCFLKRLLKVSEVRSLEQLLLHEHGAQ